MQEKHLTRNEVAILVDIVHKFGELYQNYPIYGMDNYSVQLTSKELMRLAKVLELEVEKKIYVTTDDSGTYDQRWFYVAGVKFNSQDEVK
jgi:hypothetical protein